MRISDNATVQRLIAKLDLDARTLERLRAGDPLALMLGAAGDPSEIVMSQGWLDETRARIMANLERRIADHQAGLAALGVEP